MQWTCQAICGVPGNEIAYQQTEEDTRLETLHLLRPIGLPCDISFIKQVIHDAPIQHTHVTGSVAAGFGRHGMSPPASNDTGTAFCFRN